MELGNGWYFLTTGDISWRRVIFSKKYWLRRIYARTVRHRFWLASYERLNWRSSKQKLKYSFDLDSFETNRNVDDACLLLLKNIQYNIIILSAREGNMRFCHTLTSASPRSTLVISGWEFPMLPSSAVNI